MTMGLFLRYRRNRNSKSIRTEMWVLINGTKIINMKKNPENSAVKEAKMENLLIIKLIKSNLMRRTFSTNEEISLPNQRSNSHKFTKYSKITIRIHFSLRTTTQNQHQINRNFIDPIFPHKTTTILKKLIKKTWK